ncbi:GNAT family N-acetyltransferase [Nocardia sp. NPDC057668]|uniref:GNAT family N-acetyltransferase n=1 Tax=Nocardia sp. NPDC057668 TaxID=3346202 RepID=UPI00367291E3
MGEIAVRAVTAVEAATRLDDIGALYMRVFSEPPNIPDTPANHRATMIRLLADASVAIVLADDSDDGLVGFAYGYGLTSNRWWQGLREPVTPEFTEEWEGRTFAVIDVGVAPDRRRQGIGRSLMDALLAGLPYERVTLGMIPALGETAGAFYTATGWTLVGRQDSPPDAGWTSPEFDVYVRELGTIR